MDKVVESVTNAIIPTNVEAAMVIKLFSWFSLVMIFALIASGMNKMPHWNAFPANKTYKEVNTQTTKNSI